jgi:integrase
VPSPASAELLLHCCMEIGVAAVEGKIFHDLRRTAIRNMLYDDVRERVAMLIAGHKTRSMLDRYDIVNEQDLREAAERIATRHRRRTVTASVTMRPCAALRSP